MPGLSGVPWGPVATRPGRFLGPEIRPAVPRVGRARIAGSWTGPPPRRTDEQFLNQPRIKNLLCNLSQKQAYHISVVKAKLCLAQLGRLAHNPFFHARL